MARHAAGLRRLLSRLFGPTNGDVDEELSYHIARQTELNIAAGMTPEEAERQALISFGGVEKAREECHQQWAAARMHSLVGDLQYAVRGLRRAPAFTIVTVLTFAIGIGTTTAVFSVVDRILFRSLLYYDASRLVSVGIVAPIEPQEFMLGYSYYEWQDHQTPFKSLTSWTGIQSCDLTERNALRLACAGVEASFLPTLGIGPLLGRNFTTEEDRPNAPKVVLISYSLWRSRHGADPSVVGRVISLDGKPARIIGVLNKDFELPTLEHADVLEPEAIDPASQRGANPGRVRWAFARLKPGVSIQQATAAVEPLFEQMLATVPPQFRKEVHLRVRPLRDRQLHDAKQAAWILLGAVVLMLMIACANVASLLLARAAARHREMAIRSALGASRLRIARQLVTESLAISLLGCAVGCVIGAVLLHVFISIAPEGVPLLQKAHIDLRVALFAVLASLVSGILFGVAPAMQRPNAESLAGRNIIGVSNTRARQLLVIGQIAASVVLLAGASLMMRSLWNLEQQPLGMSTRQLVTASISLGELHYGKPQQAMNFFQQLEARLRKLPGVEIVAISDSLPPGGWHHDQIYAGIRIEGRPLPAAGTGGRIAWRWVTPEYFSALDIPVVQGSPFSESDRNSSEHFIIVSQSLARYMFPNEDPVGRHLQPGLEGPWYTVVGLAADVKNGGLTGAEEPEYYRLRRNQPEDWGRNATLIVKTAFAPATTERWIRDEVVTLDNAVPVQTETMSERVSRFADRPRFEAALLSFFGLAGVLLAAIALYGLISFLVVQRTAEIGVRMALGASKGNVVRLMASQGVGLIAAGTFIGLVTALFGARAVSAVLFQVRPTDPLSFLTVALLLAVIAGVATCIPALRATSVQPMDALRRE